MHLYAKATATIIRDFSQSGSNGFGQTADNGNSVTIYYGDSYTYTNGVFKLVNVNSITFNIPATISETRITNAYNALYGKHVIIVQENTSTNRFKLKSLTEINLNSTTYSRIEIVTNITDVTSYYYYANGTGYMLYIYVLNLDGKGYSGDATYILNNMPWIYSIHDVVVSETKPSASSPYIYIDQGLLRNALRPVTVKLNASSTVQLPRIPHILSLSNTSGRYDGCNDTVYGYNYMNGHSNMVYKGLEITFSAAITDDLIII